MYLLSIILVLLTGCVSGVLPLLESSPTPTPTALVSKPLEKPSVPVIKKPIPSISPVASPNVTPVVVQPAPGFPALSVLDNIRSIAKNSKCAAYYWKERGYAPKAYVVGVSLVFARSVCQMSREDVKVVSSARKQPESQYDRTDVLSWYNSNFKRLGMSNDVSGYDTLRHVYTLLLGLGMMESSGSYCCGRDKGAGFSSADSAEAGIFQASWGAHVTSSVLAPMFEKYKVSPQLCMLDTFKEKVSCNSWDAKNWGTGTGTLWQDLTKKCPAFATEYAAVLLRTTGGTKGEFGPIRKKEVELKSECDGMLSDIQKLVQATPEVCSLL